MPHLDRTDSQVDPLLSERRRAQRRLIGALVLILGAVILLPMVLDSQPQPAPHNVTIEIPKSLFSSPDQAAANGYTTVLIPAGSTAPSVDTRTKPSLTSPGATLPKAAPPSSIGKTQPTARASTPNVPSRTSTKTTAASSRFFIHFGNFANKAQAEIWLHKLKAAGFSAALENQKTSPNTDKSQKARMNETLVIRIGPFTDRVQAQRALDIIGKMGLSKERG